MDVCIGRGLKLLLYSAAMQRVRWWGERGKGGFFSLQSGMCTASDPIILFCLFSLNQSDFNEPMISLLLVQSFMTSSLVK